MSALFSPTIRSLKQNGLNFLLFDNEERRDAFSVSESEIANLAQISQAKQTTSHNPYQRPTPSQNQPHSQSTNSSYSCPSITTESKSTTTPAYTKPVSTTQNTGMVNTSNAQVSEKEKVKNRKNETLTIEHWPNEWLNLFKRFSLPNTEKINSQIRIAWTYAGLEQDVLGPINKERQEIIRKLIIELNHKQGTHNFIPYSLVHEDGSSQIATYQNVSFFWSAMRVVRPRVLLIFGSAARDTLNMPKTLTPCQKIDMGALQVLQMHKPETLASDNDHYLRTVGFLQEYLKFCARK